MTPDIREFLESVAAGPYSDSDLRSLHETYQARAKRLLDEHTPKEGIAWEDWGIGQVALVLNNHPEYKAFKLCDTNAVVVGFGGQRRADFTGITAPFTILSLDTPKEDEE